MEKWVSLNMGVRSFVIELTLRLEQTSSSLIRTILRLFNDDLKTLGDKSSALSFKSKIDLLLDLEEIDKTDYNHLMKIMEIRNQFAHNHKAISFESLDEINPEINKYLNKFKPDESPEELPREELLRLSFRKIFEKVCGKLLVSEIEFINGIQEEFKTYINNKIVENIEQIWNDAYESNKEKFRNILVPQNSFEEDLQLFKSVFKLRMYEYFKTELDRIELEKENVFKKKISVEEKLTILKKETEE
jgi:hypothetical protein